MGKMFSISFVDMFANGLIAVLAIIVMLVVAIGSSAQSEFGFAYFEIDNSPCANSTYHAPKFQSFVKVETAPNNDLDLSSSEQNTCLVRYVVVQNEDKSPITRSMTWVRPFESDTKVVRWTSAENRIKLKGRDFEGNPIQSCYLHFNKKTEVRITASGVSCVEGGK